MREAERKRLGRRGEIVWVALIACALAVPAAIAEEANPAATPKEIAKKALKKAKAANRKAKRALAVAEETSKQQGPRGEKGDTGAPGADGADLLGTYAGGTNLTDTNGRFVSLNGGDPRVNDDRRILSPNREITLSEFALEVAAPLGGANTVNAALLVDGALSSPQISCQIATGATSCTDADQVTIPPRTALSLEVQESEAELTTVSWSFTVR